MGTFGTSLLDTQSTENAYLSVTPLPFEVGSVFKGHGVALIEEDWLQCFPHALMTPMFTQDISRVGAARDVGKLNGTGCNGFAHKVIREHVVTLMQLTVWMGRSIYDSLVVSKQDATVTNWNAKVEERELVGSNLFDSCPGSTVLGSVSGGFDCGLCLREPISWCLVEEVKYSCYCLACHEVVAEVGVDVRGHRDVLPKWRGNVLREDFLGSGIGRVGPIMVEEVDVG